MASSRGRHGDREGRGQDAREDPRGRVDPVVGFAAYQASRSSPSRSGSGHVAKTRLAQLAQLHRAFIEIDASLVEINPRSSSRTGACVALDGKMTFDDNALFRHPE